MPEYRIAHFRFLWIGGPMDTTHPRSEVITRPGSPGGEVWRTKDQPIPFTVQTLVDTNDEFDAYQLYQRYKRLSKRSKLVEMEIRGVQSTSALTTQYYVQDVRVIAVDAILIQAGKAISASSRAHLRCEWTLVPFDLQGQ